MKKKKEKKEKRQMKTVVNHSGKARAELPAKLPAEGNNLAFYLKEITRIPMMTREEEEETARAAAAGSKSARDKLVNSNLRFVVNVAKKYQGLGIPLEDLISEGNIGLINAAERFNPERNCHFISYAVWWIRQSILNAIDVKSRMIRLPGNRIAELSKIERARKTVKRQYLENEITEVAEMLHMNKEHVADLINISREMLSLETPMSQYGEIILKDLIEGQYKTPDKDTEQSILKDNIDEALNTLKKHEADIIRCHFGLDQMPPMTLSEIGNRYNLSKERIRQIKERAISRLKNPRRREKLLDYVA